MNCYTKVLETHLTICVPCTDGTKVGKGFFTKNHFFTRTCGELGHELAEVQTIISLQPFTNYNQQHLTENVALNWPHSFLHSAASDTQRPEQSKLLNQRQADSKWRACRPRALPCCCWKGRSPPTPDTLWEERQEDASLNREKSVSAGSLN